MNQGEPRAPRISQIIYSGFIGRAGIIGVRE